MGGTCAVLGVVFQVKIKATERKIAHHNPSPPTEKIEKVFEALKD
jgi:hypothetical protein